MRSFSNIWLAGLLLSPILAFGTSCAKSPPAPPADAGDHRDASLPDGPPSVWKAAVSADLFAVDHVPQFDFTLSDEQWRWLRANATQEVYVPAQASYEGQPAGLIGLRFKGNVGTLVNCFDPSGKLTCSKLSFKVSFEEYDPDNRFFGLKKLNLHSMVNDPTKLHEKLAYDLFRQSDIQAPRSTWANVRVNGASYGLFSLVEEVDGRFTADRWPGNGDGNLYKEAWPQVTAPAYYTEHLATNKSTGNTAGIVSFASDLAAAPPAELGAVLGRWIDPQALYRYMAVDDAIFNCDGVTAWYASGATGQAWGNHNFYLYQEQIRDFFWLIPWDLDATLFICAPFSAVPRWNTTPANCNQNYPVWGAAWVKPPGCDRVFQAIAQDPAGYRAAVDKLLAGPFATQIMLDSVDKWSAFIRESQIADPTAGGETPWMSAVNQLKSTIPVLRDRLMAIRDGKTLTPVTLSLTGINDFEQASALGVTLGIEAFVNPNSDIAPGLNTTTALSGQQDLRTNFVYRDSGQTPDQAYEHWIYLLLPFNGGAHNLPAPTRIHMLLRTDRPRMVRIDLESDLYKSAAGGAKFGWEVQVTNTPTAVDLLVNLAALPIWATVTTDSLAVVRTHVSGLAFNPAVVGRNGAGFLGAGNSDPGFVEIDDVQFFTE